MIILSVWAFWKYRVQKHGILYLMELTSSHYPRFLSMGYYDKDDDEIIIAKIGNWKLRIKHEEGHAKGLKHTPLYKIGYVMHPLGFLRGYKHG